MPMSSEANDSTPSRRSSVLRLLATGALTLLAGGIIAGCAATAPASSRRTYNRGCNRRTGSAAEPTAAAAAPEGVPPGPPPGGAGGPPKVITATLTNVAYANTSAAQVLDLYIPEGTGRSQSS